MADDVGSVSVWNGFAFGPSFVLDGSALSTARTGQAFAIQNALPGTERNFRRRTIPRKLIAPRDYKREAIQSTVEPFYLRRSFRDDRILVSTPGNSARAFS